MPRPLAIVLVALALLFGQGSLLPRIVECPRCADHCPMTKHQKKERLGCHSKAERLPCHSAARWASGGCGHGAEAPPLSRDLALVALPPAGAPAAVVSRFVAAPPAAPAAPAAEPPTDPPRSTFAV
jgi:hypothetical protein